MGLERKSGSRRELLRWAEDAEEAARILRAKADGRK